MTEQLLESLFRKDSSSFKFIQVHNHLKMKYMDQQSKNQELSECLAQIEQKLQWGSSADWNTQDFERLSELIQEKTGQLLSVTTLKRLWGKVKYNSAPNISTLNTLAQFVGVEDWRSFRVKLQPGTSKVPSLEASETPTAPKRSFVRSWMWAGLVPIIGFIGFYLFVEATPNTDSEFNPADFSFRSRPLAEGLPNTVIFEYDASVTKVTDKVELQQSWDDSKREEIARAQQVVTSIYYKPGYFKAKLIVNDQIMREHDIFIPTRGWLGMVDQEPVPFYFKSEEIVSPGQLSVPVDLLYENDIDPKQAETWVNFYRVERFPKPLPITNFTMQTSLKSAFKEGASACQQIRVILLCEGLAIIIPLSIPGCVSENRLWVINQGIDGKTADLSGFGANFSDWVDLRCRSIDGQISFWVNDQLAIQVPMPDLPNEIVGIKYEFQGTGAVQNLIFSNEEGMVFEEKF